MKQLVETDSILLTTMKTFGYCSACRSDYKPSTRFRSSMRARMKDSGDAAKISIKDTPI
jgi:hypothetical protein